MVVFNTQNIKRFIFHPNHDGTTFHIGDSRNVGDQILSLLGAHVWLDAAPPFPLMGLVFPWVVRSDVFAQFGLGHEVATFWGKLL